MSLNYKCQRLEELNALQTLHVAATISKPWLETFNLPLKVRGSSHLYKRAPVTLEQVGCDMCGVRTGDCSNPESNREKVYVSGAQAGKCLMRRIKVQIPGTHIKIQVWLQALRE